MSIFSRIASVFRSTRTNREIAEELESHIAEGVAAGRTSEDVRRALGTQHSQQQYQQQSRATRTLPWLDSLRADIIFGWRQLAKRKVTTAAAVLSLALAMGSCTSAFRLVDALFLRPMPVHDPGNLYMVSYRRQATQYLAGITDTSSVPFAEQLQTTLAGKAEIADASTMSHIDLTYGSDADTEKAYRQWVSGNLFSVLGIQPALGRLLTPDDDRVAANPYAVISYDYWTRRFSHDPSVVGRTFRMRDRIYQIVGVAPEGFTGTETGTMTDMFAADHMEPGLLYPNSFNNKIFVRPNAGITIPSLQSQVNSIYQAWEQVRLKGISVTTPFWAVLEPAGAGSSYMQREYRAPIIVVGILVLMVLLIACANVGNLMTAQAASRAREMALRVSIGAGRARMIQLVLIESALLTIMSVIAGVIFSWWATPYVISHINPASNPVRLSLQPDLSVVLFAILSGIAITVFFSVLPAVFACSVKPVAALKGGSASKWHVRQMYLAIATQVTFCFVVLFLAGLLSATAQKLLRQPLGFESEHLLVLDTIAHSDQPTIKWDQMADSLRSVPGVQSTALESWPLMSGTMHNNYVLINGVQPNQTVAFFLSISSGWLDTMRIPLINGRDFRPAEANPSSAIVNEAFAKSYFDGRNPVGQTFAIKVSHDKILQYQIVGLVKDVVYRDLREKILPQAYLPIHSSSTTSPDGLQPERDNFIAVRVSSSAPPGVTELLRRAVTQINSDFRVSTITAEQELVANQTIRERLLAVLASFFAAVVLGVAIVGLYGVLNYSVLQREREIGIRLALGARSATIASLVTRRTLLMVALGIAAGLALGIACTRYFQSLLYGVKPTDATALIAPVAVLLVASLLASLPAVLRAVRIDPAIMLRAE